MSKWRLVRSGSSLFVILSVVKKCRAGFCHPERSLLAHAKDLVAPPNEVVPLACTAGAAAAAATLGC